MKVPRDMVQRSSYSTVLRATAAAEMSRVQNPIPAGRKEAVTVILTSTSQLIARQIIIITHQHRY